MQYLAINTAGAFTEVCAVNGNRRAVWHDTDGKRASEVLLETIDNVLGECGLTLSALDFVGVVIGPGSFTGIRIGVSTARAFCYALTLPAVVVTYTDVLAYNERADGYGRIAALLDGSNGTAYYAEYDQNRNLLQKPVCLSQQQAIERVANRQGLAVCADQSMASKVAGALSQNDDCAALMRAVTAAYARGETVTYERIEPLYIRVSQAEQDLKEREGNVGI